MRGRPHLATVLGIAIILASGVNLMIMYAFTSQPRVVIRTAVTKAVASGKTTAIPRPKVPIEQALRSGNVEAVKLHMYWCRKEGTCDLNNELRRAVASNNPTIAKVLLAAGATVNAPGKGHGSVLHSAAAGGGTSVARVLLDAGADVNAHDEDGLTPLHSAAAWGHVELTRMLLAAGADANAPDKHSQTPLHLIAHRSIPPLAVYASVARVLLDAGARPNARAADGSTPLQLAKLSAARLRLDGNVRATGDANEVVTVIRSHGGRD